MSERGYSNNIIRRAWLELFNKDTADSAPNGEKRVLLVDGHCSHISATALLYAHEHNIELLGYPPHTTHALQGLDVVIFAALKSAYGQAVTAFEQSTSLSLSKSNFIRVFKDAWEKTMTKKNILAAFSKVGVSPVNASVISRAQMAPARANQQKDASFPLSTPKAVRAIRAVIEFPSPGSLPPSSPLAPASPSPTPSREQGTSTPVRFSQHRAVQGHRIRTMLRGTSAGFLVSSDDIQPADKLSSPPYAAPVTSSPDWHLAERTAHDDSTTQALKAALAKAQRRTILFHRALRKAHAQMALQSLHLQRLSAKLDARQKKRKDVRRVIFKGGHGALLTSDEVITAVEKDEADRTAHALEKQANAVRHKARGDKAREEKEKTATARRRWNIATAKWVRRCAAFRASHTGKRGPKMPKKPLLKDFRNVSRTPTPPTDMEIEAIIPEMENGTAGVENQAPGSRDGDDANTDTSGSGTDNDDCTSLGDDD